jgi:hypothetical protein
MLYGMFLRLLALLGKNESYARRLGVTVGTGCRILTRYFGSEPFLIEIGDRVTLSRDVMFLNHDGSTWLMRDERGRRQQFGRIRVGSDVFIGARTILLPGVEIGDRVVVGAGSVVTRSIPSGLVVAGNPARVVATFDGLRARQLSECAAEQGLPNPGDVRGFAEAAMMRPRPTIHVPETIATQFMASSSSEAREK